MKIPWKAGIVGLVLLALVGGAVAVGGGAFNLNLNWNDRDCPVCPVCPTCPTIVCPSPPKGWTWTAVPDTPPAKPKPRETLFE